MLRLAFATILFLAFIFNQVSADIRWNQGVVSHQKLPTAQVSKALVRLEIPHIRQDPGLCVPTSAAMVLSFFGESANPHKIKSLAEGHKPQNQQNRDFTYWHDLDYALKKLGYRWKIRSFPKTNGGFSAGLKQMKQHLRKGLPVLIDVHQDAGHTFVVMGFDDANQVVYVRDPNIPANKSRIFSYALLRDNWHNHQFGSDRSAFFAYKKK